MPSEQGPLDREPGRSLIAHELVHVAQQRKIGPTSIPREDSSEGRNLESHAQSVEADGRVRPAAAPRGPHTQSAPVAGMMRSVEGGGETWSAPQMATNGSAALQAAPMPFHDPGRGSDAEPVLQRAAENGRRASFAIGSHRGAAAAAAPAAAPAAAHHEEPAKLSEEQLHQAYEYFESRWRDRLWVERDLLGRRVDLH